MRLFVLDVAQMHLQMHHLGGNNFINVDLMFNNWLGHNLANVLVN